MDELALTLSQTRIARYRENQIMANSQPQPAQERVVARPLQLVAHYVRLGDREESLAFEVCCAHAYGYVQQLLHHSFFFSLLPSSPHRRVLTTFSGGHATVSSRVFSASSYFK